MKDYCPGINGEALWRANATLRYILKISKKHCEKLCLFFPSLFIGDIFPIHWLFHRGTIPRCSTMSQYISQLRLRWGKPFATCFVSSWVKWGPNGKVRELLKLHNLILEVFFLMNNGTFYIEIVKMKAQWFFVSELFFLNRCDHDYFLLNFVVFFWLLGQIRIKERVQIDR